MVARAEGTELPGRTGEAPADLLATVGSVEPGCRDRSRLTAAVAASARLRAWLDGRDVELAGQLAQVACSAEQTLAEAARVSPREAGKLLERSRVVTTVPALGESLAAGRVSGAHVDVVGRALRQLEPAERASLVEQSAWLVDVAEHGTPDELQRAVAVEVRRLQSGDGTDRLERQRRATRLRHWLDGEGMWCVHGRFDPETGLTLHGRLAAAINTLFAERVPDHAPSDLLERQDFLRAHALVALTEGRVGAGGQPEIVVVLDTTTIDGPTVDWGLPVELPTETLCRLFDTADVVPVVVRDGAVLHAPGRLDLGRSTRLASRAQRRALRALYPRCAIPGCETRFDLCKLHHVTWWEHGGGTDLDNLLPVCVHHHHEIHERGWQLALRPDRQLTITFPDGSERSTGPPRRGASRCAARPVDPTAGPSQPSDADRPRPDLGPCPEHRSRPGTGATAHR